MDLLWTCEFCQTENDITLSPQELPTSETLDYMLEPPKAASTLAAETNIIFGIGIFASNGAWLTSMERYQWLYVPDAGSDRQAELQG
jgi:hypothetical protein